MSKETWISSASILTPLSFLTKSTLFKTSNFLSFQVLPILLKSTLCFNLGLVSVVFDPFFGERICKKMSEKLVQIEIQNNYLANK